MLSRFAVIMLAAFSLTMLGCPNTAPDPCSSDADCEPCQICTSGSCVPDLQPSCQPAPTLVTIQGSVTIPNATIDVAYAGETVSAAADGDGDFAIQIPEPASTDLLLLRARDASESSFELVSLLPGSTTLVELAGADAVLSEEEHPGTRITPLSTVLYATMKAGFGRAPQTAAEKTEAEHSMRSLRDGDEIVRLAAALQLIIEDPAYSLPAGTASTVALAEDIFGARAVLEGLAAQSGGDPTASVVEVMLTDPMVTPYRTGGVPAGYYDLTLYRNGLAGTGANRWELDSNGAGVAQIGFLGWNWELHPLGWAVSATGDLELSYVAPPRTYQEFTVEQIVAFYPDDSELQEAIRTALSSLSSNLIVGRAVSMSRFARLWRGQAVDLIGCRETIEFELGTVLARYGVTAPDVVVTEDAWIELLLRDDTLPLLPWTQAMTTGARLMHVVAPSDLPDWTGYGEGEPTMAAARVAFVDGTTATATGGVSTTPLALEYEILTDGKLRLTYPTGEIQTVAVLAQSGEEIGLLSTFTKSDGGTFTWYDRSVSVNPTVGLSISQLATSANRYWQTTVLRSSYLPDSTGAMPIDSFFGFAFDTTGLADRISLQYLDWHAHTDPYVWRDETWSVQVDQGHVIMKQHMNQMGQFRCNPALEPSCYLRQERTWQPVAQHGDLVYVLESDRRSLEASNNLTWDDGQQSWVDETGSPVDPKAAYGWLFLPRINAYYTDDVPTL